MAPMLRRKIFALAKPLTESLKPGEAIYTIEHSKESFRDKKEYEARLQLYGKPIWTCKSTGSSKLTHKEAWDQEQKISKLLQQKFQSCFEKPVLEIIHHNKLALEQLVDEVYREIMTKYVLDEECNFEGANGKLMQVKIVKVYPPEKANQESPEKKAESACDASSSDKVESNQMVSDNSIKEPFKKEESGLIESEGVSEQALHSPQKHLTSLKKEEKKWAPTKFLPPKYDIKPKNEDDIIGSVPAKSLHRLESPPNKEIVRYFIRHYALRIGTGENAHWVVEDELVKRHTLASRSIVLLEDPGKYITLNSPLGTAIKKRKTLVASEKKPPSKIKVKKGEENNIKDKKQKNPRLIIPQNPNLWPQKQENETASMTQLYPNNQDSSMSPSGVLDHFTSVVSPNKLDSESNDCVLPETLSRKKTMKLEKAKNLNGQTSSRKLKIHKKDLKNPETKEISSVDLTDGSPIVSGPPMTTTKSQQTSRKVQKDASAIVFDLIAYCRDNKDRKELKTSLSSLITKAVRLLTNDDLALLPEEVRVLVEERHEKMEQKQKLAFMTEDQRKEFLREKHNKLKEKMREKAKQRREKEIQEKVEKQRRYEDQDLSGKSLPTFKLIKTPEELPKTLFGDVVMVVEFLNCYSQLLMPEDKYSVNAATLMEALTLGSGGFFYLNRVLMTLIHTLLQDKIAKDYVELGMKVSEIPLTIHSVSELVRLGLLISEAGRSNEDSSQGDNSEDSKDSASFENYERENKLLQKLKTSEYYDLTVEEKLNIMVSLCHCILSTHSVHDHVEEEQQQCSKLSKEHQAMKKVVKAKVKKQKTKDKDPKTELLNKEGEENVGNSNGEENGANIKTRNKIDLEAEDMLSAVKGQRMLLMQDNIEEEEEDRQLKEKLEIEAEEGRAQKQTPVLENALQESIAKANLVLRRSPIGTDRNHNRYWLFSDVVPGLFIENGWIHESINYTCSLSTNELTREYNPDPVDPPMINGHTDTVDTAAHAVAVETTVPKQGDNLWFICDTQKELDELLDCLHPQGVRESELKECLHKRYQDIVNFINLAHKPIPELKNCDGQKELLNHLRTDVIDLAKRLYKAGLRYVDESATFEARVKTLDNLKDFGDCLIALQASIGKRYLQGFMAPKQKAQSEDATVNTKDLDEKKMMEETNVLSKVEKWRGAIHNAKTFSRMHVLLGMLDVCIKWDMSSANARCKVCSRKGDDDQLILCDKCNKAFHLSCLRPALYEIPDGEWLCPTCQPSTARHRTRDRNYTEDSSNEEDGGNKESACQSSTARRRNLVRYYVEDSTEADESDEESSEDEDDSDYEAEDNEEEEDDYPEVMEQQLRSRKDTKTKQRRTPCSECKGHPPVKKRKIMTGEDSLQLAVPVNGADPDDLVNQSKGTKLQDRDLQLCQDILDKLIKYRFSWPFREPLIFEEGDDYMEVDINPVDFITIMSKCSCDMYLTVPEFLEDIKLVFNNAELYNHNRNHVNTCLEHTENYLVVLLQKHLPDYTYQRNKQRKRPAKRLAPITDEEDSEDSNCATSNHCRGKKAKVEA